jgi:hypothetical protein
MPTASSAATATAPTVPNAPADPTNQSRGRWLPMPANSTHPDQVGGARFCADLAAYLNNLPVHGLGG